MTDHTLTDRQPTDASRGYWQRVARDGDKMGFWFILPTFLLL